MLDCHLHLRLRCILALLRRRWFAPCYAVYHVYTDYTDYGCCPHPRLHAHVYVDLRYVDCILFTLIYVTLFVVYFTHALLAGRLRFAIVICTLFGFTLLFERCPFALRWLRYTFYVDYVLRYDWLIYARLVEHYVPTTLRVYVYVGFCTVTLRILDLHHTPILRLLVLLLQLIFTVGCYHARLPTFTRTLRTDTAVVGSARVYICTRLHRTFTLPGAHTVAVARLFYVYYCARLRSRALPFCTGARLDLNAPLPFTVYAGPRWIYARYTHYAVAFALDWLRWLVTLVCLPRCLLR